MTDAEPAAPPDFRPHAFGRYFLLQRLAAGGMAEIFRAKLAGAAGFEKDVAVKRILPSLSRDEQFVRMLVNEAKLTAQLTHGNVAQIHECGAVDGVWFIAMELVHGASVKDLLGAFREAGAPVGPEQAMYVVVQLLQGLAYAHRKTDADGRPLQIVHCDVSAENVLVTWEGEVKLLDFGIARAATGASNHASGVLMGKLGYVAPEQASLERPWDHRVDVFAAGVLLYELLTGRKPFAAAESPDALLETRRAPAPPPSSFDPRLPPELDAIAARALAFDPDDRFPDARAFGEALVDVLFPTPHSAIQESLAVAMKQVFAPRIARQRGARAHDALVMKVLRNARIAEERAFLPGVDAPAEPFSAAAATPAPRRRRARPVRLPLARAAAVALAGAALGAGATSAWQRRTETGALLVTSVPPGAKVTVDGVEAPAPAPVVVEGLRLAEPHVVVLSAPERRTATVRVPPGRGAVRAVDAALEPATVALRVESAPAGARVRVDGRPAGATPVTVTGLRADERHRVDLELAGHELDQFVVLPDRDGTRFRRTLAKRVTAR